MTAHPHPVQGPVTIPTFGPEFVPGGVVGARSLGGAIVLFGARVAVPAAEGGVGW